MGAARTVALVGLTIAAGFAAVIGVRTATFKPPSQVDLKAQRFPAAPPIDANAAAGRLAEAIRFRTVTHQDPTQDEPAELDKLEAWLIGAYPAAHKAMLREVVAEHTLIYTWKGSDPALAPMVLMAHQDVVPITPGTEGDWKHQPFAGDIADGAVWGRGAIDDKSSLISLFEAVEALAVQGFAPRRTIIVVSTHNEEKRGDGGKAAAAYFKAHGIKASWVLDEGFSGTTEDGFTGKPLVRIQTAEKGYATLTVTAKAEGGHSSAPPPETAVATLAKAVLKITGDPYAMHLRSPVREGYLTLAPSLPLKDRIVLANLWLFEPMFVKRLAATPTGAASLHTTIAPTMLEGAPKDNVLPQKAIARINFRIAQGGSAQVVMARAKRDVRGLPVELAFEKPPFDPSPVSSTTSEGWKQIAGLASQTAGAPVVPGLMRAGTDSYFFRPVADDVYLYTPLILTPAEEKTVHGTNEKVRIADLGKMIAFYARLIQGGAG
jgi:carboxypeptidase PM20D1